MKYNSVMSPKNLAGKFARSTEEEIIRYKQTKVHVTEKTDGEHWRTGLVEGRRVIGGRKHLFYWDETAEEFLHEDTNKPHPNWNKINEETKEEIFRTLDELEETYHTNIILYGELYGNGLQKRFTFAHEEYAVIYYEMAIDEKYLDQMVAYGWFEGLKLKTAPYFGEMTLEEFLNIDVEVMKSEVATNDFIEGLVAVPVSIGEIFEWDFPSRFIVKKKTKRFDETKPEKTESKEKYQSPYSIHVTEERLIHVLQNLKEEGIDFSHEKEFRMLVVEKMLTNIQNEENDEKEFSKDDRKVLTTEAHKLFSHYNPL